MYRFCLLLDLFWALFLVKCEESEFQCSPGHCIPRKWLCDGGKDCSDGSDENATVAKCNGTSNCAINEFTCANSRCIQEVNFFLFSYIKHMVHDRFTYFSFRLSIAIKKTTVGTIQMNQTNVCHVPVHQTNSNVQTIDVFRRVGSVMELTTVEITVMKH